MDYSQWSCGWQLSSCACHQKWAAAWPAAGQSLASCRTAAGEPGAGTGACGRTEEGSRYRSPCLTPEDVKGRTFTTSLRFITSAHFKWTKLNQLHRSMENVTYRETEKILTKITSVPKTINWWIRNISFYSTRKLWTACHNLNNNNIK